MTSGKPNKRFSLLIAAALLLSSLATTGCGTSGARLVAFVNGQQQKVRVDRVEAVSFGLQSPTGLGGTGFGGGVFSILISVVYQGSGMVDMIRMDFNNSANLGVGQTVYFDGIDSILEVTYGGIPQFLNRGTSVATFLSPVSGFNGEQVDLDIKIEMPFGAVAGNVSARIENGFY